MLTWLEFAIPGGVLLLVATAGYESRSRRRRKRPGTPLSATYVNELTAFFYGSKRMELDHRDSMSLMCEEDAQGAPRLGVDLDRGIVVLASQHPATAPDGFAPTSSATR